MTPEGKVKAAIKQVLDLLECWYYMPVASMYNRAGIPDFIGCHKGRFFAIEAKAKRGRLTALQKDTIEQIQSANGICFVVYNVEDAVRAYGEMKQW